MGKSVERKGPPSPRTTTIARERLLRLIDDLEGRKLVTLVAPAGYGKTTLLSAWYERLVTRGVGARWLTLDAHADSADRVVASIARAFAHDDVVLLDELEAIRASDAESALAALLASLPPGKTLVVASRTLPELGLARLRLGDELLEVRAEDLRFDLSETTALLAADRSVSLGEEAVRRLHRSTEGWVAALRLTQLALAGRRDAEAFVGALTGDRATIAEYLAEAVIARQPEAVRTFLLETSILARMTGPLCEAVTGTPNGFAMLDALEKSQLFVTPLDDRRVWFRYHALFGEYLRAQIARQRPERLVRLHHTAAHWLAENGHTAEAVDHAFAAGDQGLAARLLDECALDSVRAGRNSVVLSWVERLSPKLLENRPAIRVAEAWARVFLRDVPKAKAALDALRRADRERPLAPAVRDEFLTARAAFELIRDRIVDAMDRAREGLDGVSRGGTFAHGALSNIVGFGLLETSRFAEARRFHMQGRASMAEAKSRFGEAYSIELLGLGEALQGRLDGAIAFFRQVGDSDLEVDDPAGAVVGAPYAEVLYERGALAEARPWLDRALALGDEFTWLGSTGLAPLTLARLHFAEGRTREAEEALEAAELAALRRRSDRVVDVIRWERVRLWLRTGDLGRARELARTIAGTTGTGAPEDQFHYLAENEARDVGRLRLEIRAGNARGVLAEIATRAAEAARLGRRWRWLKLEILEAEALAAVNEHPAALRALREALRLGASEGFLRSFADEGEAIVPLLLSVRAGLDAGEGRTAGHVDRILHACGAKAAPHARGEASPRVEPLSTRELEVLALAGRGLSNRSLARRLFISENTVKTHLKNAFAKLGAANRTEALYTARQRGILG